MSSADLFQRSTAVPPTPGEGAAQAANWERRGLFDRLVRVEDPAPAARWLEAREDSRAAA
jgi:hypothetical protein